MTLFHVTEMRFTKKIIPKTLFHVILWITNEYVICNFQEINPRKKIFSCNWNVLFGEINSNNKNVFFKLSAYKTGVSMRLFKLQFLEFI